MDLVIPGVSRFTYTALAESPFQIRCSQQFLHNRNRDSSVLIWRSMGGISDRVLMRSAIDRNMWSSVIEVSWMPEWLLYLNGYVRDSQRQYVEVRLIWV